jgi:holo-[acyl-carrier protein] synthase
MVTGIGTDIVEINRIKDMISSHNSSFIDKIFTPKEQSESKKRKDNSQYYAGRWAAKEALSKALGCGFGAKCAWLDVEILNNSEGKPEVTLYGNGLQTSQDLECSSIHVSISHEKEYASAFVVLEK